MITIDFVILQVTHVWQNMSHLEHPGLRADGCFYTGKVRGDLMSSVSVSLCHGMVSNTSLRRLNPVKHIPSLQMLNCLSPNLVFSFIIIIQNDLKTINN